VPSRTSNSPHTLTKGRGGKEENPEAEHERVCIVGRLSSLIKEDWKKKAGRFFLLRPDAAKSKKAAHGSMSMRVLAAPSARRGKRGAKISGRRSKKGKNLERLQRGRERNSFARRENLTRRMLALSGSEKKTLGKKKKIAPPDVPKKRGSRRRNQSKDGRPRV